MTESHDAELHRLAQDDQQDRTHHPPHGTPEYRALRARDKQRRRRVTEILLTGGPTTGEGYHDAALILQHSDAKNEIWKAHRLALKSVELGYRPARWLSAATYDRYQMYQGKPQKFGTQMVPDGKRYRLWDVDPDTTDQERAEWDVESLVELRDKAAHITDTIAMPQMDDAPPWLKEAMQRWAHEEQT